MTTELEKYINYQFHFAKASCQLATDLYVGNVFILLIRALEHSSLISDLCI